MHPGLRSSWRRALSSSALVSTLAVGCGGAAPPPVDAPQGSGRGAASEGSRGPQKVKSVATGDFHTCVVVVGGTVMCFGRDRDGELGDGGASGNRTRPLAVPNLRDVEDVAAGSGFSCARLKDGTVRCWGSGAILGDDRVVEKVRPTAVSGLSDVVELKAGGLVACARNKTGAVKCWGADAVKSGAPTAGAEEIAVSGAHACARTLEGKVTCFGEGLAATKGGKPITLDVAKATALSTGDSFACVVVDAQVRCFGRNDQGELGSAPDKESRNKPTPVKNATGIEKIVSAESRTCALATDKTVRCFGSNHEGELGRGSKSVSEPIGPVSGLSNVVEVAVGAGHACARTDAGEVLCWGGNRQGQLGDGTNESRTTPVRVAW